MTGRIGRSVSAASSSGIESSASAERPLKSLPFITATFMKRTVSKARRTMSWARARVTASGSSVRHASVRG